MSDNGEDRGTKQGLATSGQVRVLREDDINQFADFVTVASQQREFRERLVAVINMSENSQEFKADKRRAFAALMTDYGLVDTDRRYKAILVLCADENGKTSLEVLEKLWAFALAFGHKDVGQFN